MNPLFTIEPWELPPDCDAPLVAPADFVLEGLWEPLDPICSIDVWLRILPYQDDYFLIYFCSSESSQDGNWVVPWAVGRHGFDIPCREAMDDLFTQDEERTKVFANRRVYFDGSIYGFPGWFCFTTSMSGDCHLRLHTHNKLSKLKLAIPLSPPPFHSTSQEIKELLLTALDNKNSEARFTLQWRHLTDHQQQEKALCFERGTLSEMQTLMQAVLCSQSDLWHTQTTLYWATRDWSKNAYFGETQLNVITADQGSLPRYGFEYQHRPIKFINPQTPYVLHRWKYLLWDYFNPSFNEEVFNFAQCMREASESLATIVATAASPTAHEHLESLLILRDWWQDKFPGQSLEEFNANG